MITDALDLVVHQGIRYTALGEQYGVLAKNELRDLRAYAARMKAERDAWSEEAGRLGLELARLKAKESAR